MARCEEKGVGISVGLPFLVHHAIPPSHDCFFWREEGLGMGGECGVIEVPCKVESSGSTTRGPQQ